MKNDPLRAIFGLPKSRRNRFWISPRPGLVGLWLLGAAAGSRAAAPVPMAGQPGPAHTQTFGEIGDRAENFGVGAGNNPPKPGPDQLTTTATAGKSDDPAVTITNPAPAKFTVGTSTRTQRFSGTCNPHAVGQLVWTNALTGESGGCAAATNWSIPEVYLGVGTNVVTVRATNQAGIASESRATICRDMREFIKVMTANLTDRATNNQFRYIATSERIFKALQPDVVAIQEWLVTNASRRAYVDAVFGTNYYFFVESYSGSELPNGVISRWPITASGEWNDTQVSGRDFAWAAINLPGTQDLRVVSVHLKSGSATADEATRKKEAAILTNEIRKAKWPAADFIVVAGDFNTPNRNDDSLLTLSNVVTDAGQPADQAGDRDTNLTRAYPYDYVLPNPQFHSCMVPLTLGGLVFSNGLVFDSRVWAAPPAPVQTNDSAGTDMQHLAVMKQFALLTCTDCDDDALPDSWEIGNFGSITTVSARTDWDADGFSDVHEFLAGTQPTNGASALFMKEPAAADPAGRLIRWDSVAGKQYRILRSTNLNNGFAAIRTGIAAAPPVNVFTDLPPPGATVLYGVGLDP